MTSRKLVEALERAFGRERGSTKAEREADRQVSEALDNLADKGIRKASPAEILAEAELMGKGGLASDTLTMTLDGPPLAPDDQAEWLNETLATFDDRLTAIIARGLANPKADLEKQTIRFDYKVNVKARRVDLTLKARYDLYQ